jgi:hypothetical protein
MKVYIDITAENKREKPILMSDASPFRRKFFCF